MSFKQTVFVILGVWVALITGCTSPSLLSDAVLDIETPRSLQVTPLKNGIDEQPGILVVQAESLTALRWSWMNLLGAPYARQILEKSVWRNDGFLPPNAPARLLFSGVILAWSSTTEMQQRFSSRMSVRSTQDASSGETSRSLLQDGEVILTVSRPSNAQPDHFIVLLPDGDGWRIQPLTPRGNAL